MVEEMDIQSGVGSLCRLIAMKSAKRFHDWMEEQGVVLTPEQAFVVSSVAKEGELHQSDLMSLTFFVSEKSKVSRIVQSLVEDGYLHRREDESDRRSKVLTLTEEGERVAVLLKQAADSNVALYRTLLSDWELTELQRKLKRVLEAL